MTEPAHRWSYSRITAIVFSFIKTVLSLSSILKEDSRYRDILISSGSLNSKITRLMYAKEKRKEKRNEGPLSMQSREKRGPVKETFKFAPKQED
jgi:hypothetical protein